MHVQACVREHRAATVAQCVFNFIYECSILKHGPAMRNADSVRMIASSNFHHDKHCGESVSIGQLAREYIISVSDHLNIFVNS